ncbi:hypothetical protein MBLNU13_g10306t2 [Cladosporium sp. NU13]
MPFSALASYIVVASVTCPRRASETRTVPKVAAYRTSNVEEPAMDPYLKYQPAYRILVCRQCSVGVWPNAVTAHFRSEAHEFTLPQIRRLVEDLKDHRLDLCRPGELQIPDSPVVSLSDLPVYLDGQRCILDPAKCAYVCRNEKVLRKHWKDEHGFSLCEVLGGSGAAKKEMIAERLQFSVRRPIPCQRLFASRHGSQYFEVYLDTARPTVDTTRRGSAKDAILSELASLEKTQQLTGRTFVATSSSKEISPWLQLTRWLGYLDGCTLCDTARLAWSPSAGTEGDLVEVCASLDRILDQALAAIQEDRVNPFDQMRINSFLQRPRASDKPLAFRLQKSTHRAYRDVWKRLLCFAHRTLKHDQLPRLRHRLTNGQIVEHAELFRMVEYLRCLKASCDDTEEMLRAARADVDHSCLRFCMSLLDHTLNGDIYESVIVGFFAVAAIDVTKNILREAHVYSSLLSGFVKIAQMLVIQRAIVGVEKGEATYPAELIDELRERFLVYSSRTPFSWACRLRAYAKKVRDSTTSLGCILWNEEGNAVSYKQIGQLTMVSLREFVSAQVRKAQSQLEGLLLLHPQQRRNDLGVDFWMHRVADDASNSSCSWNFLRLERNTTGQLPIRDNWLLERVLDEHWLSDEFLKDAGSDNLRWRPTAVRKYKTKVEEFLESLLLLVHITGGQPGREDLEAVINNVEIIRRTRGGKWPSQTLTEADNLLDLAWHEREQKTGTSFAYVVRDDQGTYLGCFYLKPLGRRT